MTPRPAQPTPGSGPPELDAANVAEADLHDVLEFEVLDAAGFSGEAQDGVLRLGVQDESRRIRLGVATDDEDLLVHRGEGREGVLRGGRLADAALAVKCDLSQ